MACPKCGCKTVYSFEDEDEPADDTDDDEPEAGQWELPEDQKPQE